MKTTTKTKSVATRTTVIRKPEGLPKVVFGTGRNLGFMSETLFDEDLKQ